MIDHNLTGLTQNFDVIEGKFYLIDRNFDLIDQKKIPNCPKI